MHCANGGRLCRARRSRSVAVALGLAAPQRSRRAASRADRVTDPSPFQPSLTDPRQRAALQQAAGRHHARRSRPGRDDHPQVAGAGETGFDSTGSIAKKRKREAQARRAVSGAARRRRAIARAAAAGERPDLGAADRRARRLCQCLQAAGCAAAPSAAAQHRSVRAGRRAGRQLPAAAVDRSRRRLRQQSEPHAERAALGLHQVVGRSCRSGRSGRATNSAQTCAAATSRYDSHAVAQPADRRRQGVRRAST